MPVELKLSRTKHLNLINAHLHSEGVVADPVHLLEVARVIIILNLVLEEHLGGGERVILPLLYQLVLYQYLLKPVLVAYIISKEKSFN